MGGRRSPLGSVEVQPQEQVVNLSVVSEMECIP